MKKLILVLCLLFSIIEIHGQNFNKVKVPKYYPGTEWKFAELSFNLNAPAVMPDTAISLFKITGDTIVDKKRAYVASWTQNLTGEKPRIGLAVIGKKHLDMMAVWEPGANKMENVSLQFKLLDFPLFIGKTWEADMVIGMAGMSESIRWHGKFKVLKHEVWECVNGVDLSSENFSFLIEYAFDSDVMNGKAGTFHYLAPESDFPGSPVMMVFLESQTAGTTNGTGSKYYMILDYHKCHKKCAQHP